MTSKNKTWRARIELRDLSEVNPEEFRAAMREALDGMKAPKSVQFNCRISEGGLEDIRSISTYHRISQSDVIELFLSVARTIGMVPEKQ